MAEDKAEFYLYELWKIPAKLWTVAADVKAWLESYSDTAGKCGFAPNSLAALPPCGVGTHVSRCLTYPMYFLTANILPVAIPVSPLLRLFWRFPKLKHVAFLVLLELGLFRFQASRCWKQIQRRLVPELRDKPELSKDDKAALSGSKKCMSFQLDEIFDHDRPNHTYFGTKWILPRSIVEASESFPPSILAVTPHGLIPWGQSGAGNKLFGGRATRWAAAPVLFNLYGMRDILKAYGCYPAGKKGIIDCLARGDHALLELDGIAGMFCGDNELYLLQRKAICAIALQAGAPIIPAFCFGQARPCKVVDPTLGLLRRLSIRMDISLSPWLGRWWLPFGPPSRQPMAMCWGDPIPCQKLDENADRRTKQEAVDAKHTELLEAYKRIFDTHKHSYGWPDATLKFV